jgi:hypothetical protein
VGGFVQRNQARIESLYKRAEGKEIMSALLFVEEIEF